MPKETETESGHQLIETVSSLTKIVAVAFAFSGLGELACATLFSEVFKNIDFFDLAVRGSLRVVGAATILGATHIEQNLRDKQSLF